MVLCKLGIYKEIFINIQEESMNCVMPKGLEMNTFGRKMELR